MSSEKSPIDSPSSPGVSRREMIGGAAGGVITRTVGLELAELGPWSRR